jgi:RNA polymerase sigma factor (sigma-70 family)
MSYTVGLSATHERQVHHTPLIVPELTDELARHHRAAFGWALACCRWDRSAAEDVLQTAYLKMMDGRARFGGQSEFRTFLFGVIRRTALDERRRRAVRSAFSLDWLRSNGHEPSAAASALSGLIVDENNSALVAALATLSGRQREVLHLVFYQDLTIAEAASVLDISIGSARAHYERGKARLRELLGGDT